MLIHACDAMMVFIGFVSRSSDFLVMFTILSLAQLCEEKIINREGGLGIHKPYFYLN